ncbi:MAG: cold-shock protein [Candidatus Cyclobacteriaceae bacterium M2_1C_046]
MAKSRETYSKKEKEKKKLKKKQDKAEKREERKAASKSGDLEDMLAYVDEFGNITDTPPDPTKKKKEVKAKDIVVGVPKQAEPDPDDAIRKGTVTFFNESKGYGFIKDHETQDSIFVHMNACIDQIGDNDKVTFEVERTPKGLSAVDVKLAEK